MHHQCSIDDSINSIVDVGIIKDEYRSLGSELEDAFLEDFGSICSDVATHFVAPGKRDPSHGLVINDVLGETRRILWSHRKEIYDTRG
jgi:hypothetical protein